MSAMKKTQGELVEAALFHYDGHTPLPLIDIGANLADPSFDTDREEVIARAKRAGIAALVATGTSVLSTGRAAKLAESSQ